MSLFAPLAVAVEVRAEEGEHGRRIYRLSNSVAESGLMLERPAPFDIGRPVTVRFTLPDLATITPLAVRARVSLTDDDGEGEHGGSHLEFVDPPRESRQSIMRYVMGRLGLPGGEPVR